MLEIFQDLKIEDFDLSETHKIKDLSISFSPLNGNLEEFDYHLSLDTNTFVGVEAEGLKFTGKG